MADNVKKSGSVTMKDIAKQAGVSVGTVSRVFSGFEDVSAKNLLLVQEAAIKLDYQPSTNPWRSTRRKKLSKTIVVPINRKFDMNFVGRQILGMDPGKSFEKTLKQYGFELYFKFVDGNKMAQTVAELAEDCQRCDGVWILSGICSEEMADILSKTKFPHVSEDHRADQYAVNTVHAHAADGIRQAVQHLVVLGHEDIGFLGMPVSDRYGYTIANLTARGLPIDGVLLGGRRVEDFFDDAIPRHWYKTGHMAMSQLIADGLNVTALVCTNDDTALGAAQALREHNIEIGKDISLVGYDNIEERGRECDITQNPILTTIDNPTDRIGKRMAELLLNQILHGQSQIVHEQLPAPLIVRESTNVVNKKITEPQLEYAM